MTDFKKKYKEYKKKYRELKRKTLASNYQNPYEFQPIRPSPVLFRQPYPVPVQVSVPVSIPVPIMRPSVLIGPRPPSPILFNNPIRVVPIISEKTNYLVVATLNDIYKFRFTKAIKLLRDIYFSEYYLKENTFEPKIILAYIPRITSYDADKINQILGGFINRYREVDLIGKFININFSNKNPERIEIYASIEFSILSEINVYLRENVPEIKLFTEENKLNITLLYLKPNIEYKIITNAIENAKNMLTINSINEGDYIPIQSIQLRLFTEKDVINT